MVCLCAALLMPSGVALAQAAAGQTRPIDPQSEALAHQIVDASLPPEKASHILDSSVDSLMRPMEAKLRNQFDVGDAGLTAIINDFMAQVLLTVHNTMVPKLPQMRAAMARSYVRLFAAEDLAQIAAFAKTPSGARYFAHATEVLQDKEVLAFNAEMFTAVQTAGAPALAQFKTRLGAYMAAHPELVAKLKAKSP